MEDNTKLLTPKQAADLLNISEHRLYLMRRLGEGPAFVRMGHRTIRYRASEVERFITSMTEEGGDHE